MERSFSLQQGSSNPAQASAYASNLINNYDFQTLTDRLKFLYRCLCAPLKDCHTQAELYLKAGCKMFSAPIGLVCASYGPYFKLEMGYFQSQDVVSTEFSERENAICRDILDHGLSMISEGAESHFPIMNNKLSVHLSSFTYNDADGLLFFGIPLIIAGNPSGVLCFATDSSFQENIVDADTLKLMAEGVARMIELQNAQDKNKVEEIRGFATAGVKTLDEYRNQAQLPEVYGVSGRVVEVLNRRIGHLPLGIDYIADELNLSKRTLQRRLQQQNISFAQLRDQVRFHFSLDYLINQSHSIDAISAALDFSDRTSFTNAFKRWTMLSPSIFRKLFRDYA